MTRTRLTPRIPLLLLFFSIAPFTARAQSELPDAIHPSSEVSRPIESQKERQNPGHNSYSTDQPLTAGGRFDWFVSNTIGAQSLAAGLFSAGFGTAIDKPKEYGPHWEGFGKRYGMRLTGIATQNATEAGLGAFWGEDPRYFRAPEESFGRRVRHIIKLTFVARRRNGNFAPAYARFIAIPSANFLSNSWRADSEATNGNAIGRTFLGFAGRMAGNAFMEFWPDLTHRIFHRK